MHYFCILFFAELYWLLVHPCVQSVGAPCVFHKQATSSPAGANVNGSAGHASSRPPICRSCQLHVDAKKFAAVYAEHRLVIILIHRMIFIVLSSTAPAICESSLWIIWAKVCQRQVAASSYSRLLSWPLSPPVSCYMPKIRQSPFVLVLNHKSNSFTVLRMVEGWVDLGTGVSV